MTMGQRRYSIRHAARYTDIVASLKPSGEAHTGYYSCRGLPSSRHIPPCGSVLVSMPAWHAGDLGSIPGPGMFILGVKTWLSTLEIVNLSVFRMRQ